MIRKTNYNHEALQIYCLILIIELGERARQRASHFINFILQVGLVMKGDNQQRQKAANGISESLCALIRVCMVKYDKRYTLKCLIL